MQTFCPGHLIAGMPSLHLALDHLIILLPTLNFLKCFQKLLFFFFRKHLLSDFWGIKAILKHIYRFFLLKKKHPDLDPTDLGLVFGILIYVDDDAGDND